MTATVESPVLTDALWRLQYGADSQEWSVMVKPEECQALLEYVHGLEDDYRQLHKEFKKQRTKK